MKEKFRIAGIKKSCSRGTSTRTCWMPQIRARFTAPRRKRQREKEAGVSWTSSSRCFSSRTSRRRTSDSSPGSSTNGTTGMANTSLKRGKPGTALYIVRSGVVEIMRGNGMARRSPL